MASDSRLWRLNPTTWPLYFLPREAPRGFTRDIKGKKFFIDHRITSIQDFISKDTKDRYQMIDVNVYQENIFHTKMMLKQFDLDNYLFGIGTEDLTPREEKIIRQRLQREMAEMFYGENLRG